MSGDSLISFRDLLYSLILSPAPFAKTPIPRGFATK
jgi:hypothetical protein